MLSGSPTSFLKSSEGAVVEALAGGPVQPQVQGLALDLAAFAPLVFGQDCRLRRGEHAVETAQHRHRQHHALVLRGPIRAAQQVRDLPDQVREVAVVRHRLFVPALRRRPNIIARMATVRPAMLGATSNGPGRIGERQRTAGAGTKQRAGTYPRPGASPSGQARQPAGRIARTSSSGGKWFAPSS